MPQPRYPSLAGSVRTEVAVVGGGMTGALVAQAFAEAGVSVVLLESELVASGSTAASSALLLQEPDKGLLELEQWYGRLTSRTIWQVSHDAVPQLVSLLKRLRISCQLTHRDAIYYATTGEAVERLRREFETRTEAGFEVQWLTPGQLRRLTAHSWHRRNQESRQRSV